MQRGSDLSLRPHIGWVVAYHAEALSQRRN